MNAAAIYYLPDVPDQVTPAAECAHPGPLNLAVGMRIEKSKAVVDCMFCLGCGTAHANNKFTSWAEAWQATWSQHGWHMDIGRRLQLFRDLFVQLHEKKRSGVESSPAGRNIGAEGQSPTACLN